ncbi:MAG: hypothetical protein AB7L09_02490 [Nitrospira sp.]
MMYPNLICKGCGNPVVDEDEIACIKERCDAMDWPIEEISIGFCWKCGPEVLAQREFEKLKKEAPSV